VKQNLHCSHSVSRLMEEALLFTFHCGCSVSRRRVGEANTGLSVVQQVRLCTGLIQASSCWWIRRRCGSSGGPRI